MVAEHLECVAFRSGNFVSHRFLGKEVKRGLESFLEAAGVENPDELARQFYETLEQAFRFCQGYCGSLVNNLSLLKWPSIISRIIVLYLFAQLCFMDFNDS